MYLEKAQNQACLLKLSIVAFRCKMQCRIDLIVT